MQPVTNSRGWSKLGSTNITPKHENDILLRARPLRLLRFLRKFPRSRIALGLPLAEYEQRKSVTLNVEG